MKIVRNFFEEGGKNVLLYGTYDVGIEDWSIYNTLYLLLSW